MQKSWLGPENTAACKILYASITISCTWLCIHRNVCNVAHTGCVVLILQCFTMGTETKQTLLIQSACLQQSKQKLRGHTAVDSSSSDDLGGTWTQKRVPAESQPVQRPYCAHGMIHWIEVKSLCGGAEANRSQCYVQRCCDCRVWQVFNPTAHNSFLAKKSEMR